MELLITDGGAVEDHGTIVIIEGTNDTGCTYRVGVDHRPAQEILNIVAAEGELLIDVKPWQLLGGTA